MKALLSAILIIFIKGYKYLISPFLMPSCRFTPSCSEYGLQAIKKHGPFKGGYLTFKRVISCHPWGKHGHDPVP